MARYRYEYSDTYVDKAVAEGKITMDDADLIKLFMNGQYSEDNGPTTMLNSLYKLILFREYIGEYRKNTLDDLFVGVRKFKESGRKPTAVIQYLEIFRNFYLWLIDQGYSSIPRDIIAHKIKVRRPEPMSDPPLSLDDVLQLIRACKNSRERAFIALLYESATRTRDAGSLTWGEFIVDPQGVFLVPDKKTKSPGHIPCVMATGYLVAWRSEYPGDPEGDNLVFITQKGKPFTIHLATRLLGRIVRKSGISTPVHLHSLKQGKAHHKTSRDENAVIKKMLWEIS